MVKLTKELFSKLPQLDRIEYRQRQDRIKEMKSNLTGLSIAVILGAFIIGSLFIGLCWGGADMIYFLHKFQSNLPYLVVLIIFSFILDIVVLKKRQKLYEELFEEYFDVDVLVKRGYNGKKRK